MINDIPPKQTPGGNPLAGSSGYDTLPPADPAPGGLPQHGLVLHDSSMHGDANSFPVLKAFQDYLEMERQQARKRLVTLTVFFVSLMTLVVAGFIVAFIFFFNSMSKRDEAREANTRAREDRLLEAALQPKKEAAPAAANPGAVAAQQVAREFQAVAQDLQTNLNSQLATVGAVAARIDDKVAAQNSEMAKMHAALAAMQKENEALRTDMPKLALEAARKLPPPNASLSTPPVAAPRPGAGSVSHAVATAGTPAASAGTAPRGYEEAVVLIRSRDGENSIPWHTFVPK